MEYIQRLVTPKFYSGLSRSQFNNLVKEADTFYQVNGVGIYKGSTLIATMDSTQGWIKNNDVIVDVNTIPVADASSPDFIKYNNELYRKIVPTGQTIGNYKKILTEDTKYASNLSLTINSSDYKITARLKDQDGNNLGDAQVIDLPLESVVVNGRYDNQTEKIILTLQNGNTISFGIGDLINGLQPTLVSGTNIKTINHHSILGEGDIEISGLDLIDNVSSLPTATSETQDFVNLLNAQTNGELYRKRKYKDNNADAYNYEKILVNSDKTELEGLISGKVGLTGNEEIAGTKIFTSQPQYKVNNTTEKILVESDIVANNNETTTATLHTLKINGTNYKASDVLANPSTTATQSLDSIEIDGVTYSVRLNENAKSLLWTNIHYDEPFVGVQNPIPLDLTTYDLVIVVINNDTSATNQISHIYNRDNLTYRADASFDGKFVYRNVQVSNAAVTFGNGNKYSTYDGTLVEDNTVAIPYQIYGIRLKLSSASGGGGGTEVIANPAGIASTDLLRLSVDGITYGIRGTEVIANPTDAITPLNSIQIDGSKYKIESTASIPIRRL